MRRQTTLITTAFFTFVIGVGANSLINYFITDETVAAIERCSDYASALMLWREPKLVSPAVNSCGHLVITIDDDGQLYLDSRWMGSLDRPQPLMEELKSVFRKRTKFHYYRAGMEQAYEVPENERIDKTVYLKADPGLSYGEVQDLIERIKIIGANPIGLLSKPQYPFTEY